jgi:SGNH domain (fused to AT3 domains)
LLSFARIVEGEVPSSTIRLFAVLLSIVLAWLTYKFLERPIRLDKHSNVKVTVLLVMMTLVGYIGYNTFERDGLKFRAAAKNNEQFRVDALKEEKLVRQTEIRAGICHFNKKGQNADIESFVANWKCFSDDKGLKNPKILLFGDSHAADKSMGLRLNGVDIVQVGGAGCSINPNLATDQRSYCKYIFDIVKRHAAEYDVIFLSNEFPMSEINADNINQVFNYWSGSKQVYLFTPMPDFTTQMKEFLKNGKTNSQPDFSREDAFLHIVENMVIPSNFKIIKSSEIWCLNRATGDKQPCSFVNKGEIMMIDGGHLSARGSKIFGKNMISHPGIEHLLNHN